MLILHWIVDPAQQQQVALCGHRGWGIVEVADVLEAHAGAILSREITCTKCAGMKPLHDLASMDLE